MLNLEQPINPFNNQSNHIDSRAHILYVYNEIDKYIANAFSFILEGLSRNEVVALVDTDEVVAKIKEMMAEDGLEMTSFQNLIVMESKDIYLLEDEFDINQAETLIKRITPYLEKGYAINWALFFNRRVSFSNSI
ncbi:MEDS domain-containing protein [Peribacillus asahii]|uniref:MEDS domain-containing protein n=1 Tax=Peribacillus asahii TaxID=228899 RepID=UPI00381CFB0F